MSILDFGNLIKSEVFSSWLKKLDKNIVNSTVKNIRAQEQVAAKTDFILSVKDIKKMYKTVTNKELSGSISRRVLKDIASAGKLNTPAKALRVSGSGALFFENIGFDTITKYVTQVFNELEGVSEGYTLAAEAYLKKRTDEINKKTFKSGADKQTELTLAEVAASKIGFGTFFHKGHVISIATNSTKAVRDSIDKANEFTEEQKSLMLGVLDKYISKLQKDDLASANLSGSIDQKLYVKYTKSHEKYLVEIQISTDNMESGSASLPIVNELRKVFSTSGKELEDILTKSPQLGSKLINTKGSPSYLQLLADNLAAVYSSGKGLKKVYNVALQQVAVNKRPVKNTKSSKEINELKALKQKIKAVPKVKTPVFKESETSLTSLLVLLNTHLQSTISANMGNGMSPNVLNYRTGRLAASAKVDRLTESRAGMITAFYSYMRNPYGTFSEGGAQSSPRTRDPKLLISKSIREIAAEQVDNKLRAVLV